MSTDWISWEADKPPPPGTQLRLRFVNKVISNPITIQDGRGLNWGNHTYSWAVGRRAQMGWRIEAYQIIT
jgi:hypothetical protein